LGTVHHEILERVYAEVGRRGLNIEPDALDAALAILAEIGPAVLAAAPDRLGFRVTAQWEAEREGVMRRLEGLLRLDFSEKHPLRKLAPGPRRPYRQEASFGTDGGPTVAIPIEVDGVTELLTARGYIDRMDQVGDGVVLVDYKTGSTPIPVTEMMDGRNFQMMLYLLAAHALVVSDPDGPSAVLGGAFWHIRGNKPSGTIAWDEEGEAAVEVARGHLGRYIAAGRRGDFSVQPRKADHGRCNHYCEYAQLCRLSSTNQRKTES
jgi:ATP-dependent helicase/DNAse subunit B